MERVRQKFWTIFAATTTSDPPTPMVSCGNHGSSSSSSVRCKDPVHVYLLKSCHITEPNTHTKRDTAIGLMKRGARDDNFVYNGLVILLTSILFYLFVSFSVGVFFLLLARCYLVPFLPEQGKHGYEPQPGKPRTGMFCAPYLLCHGLLCCSSKNYLIIDQPQSGVVGFAPRRSVWLGHIYPRLGREGVKMTPTRQRKARERSSPFFCFTPISSLKRVASVYGSFYEWNWRYETLLERTWKPFPKNSGAFDCIWYLEESSSCQGVQGHNFLLRCEKPNNPIIPFSHASPITPPPFPPPIKAPLWLSTLHPIIDLYSQVVSLAVQQFRWNTARRCTSLHQPGQH